MLITELGQQNLSLQAQHPLRVEILQLLRGYRLTTAEIIYHLPDHPHLLQTYVWQDYDLAPQFPILHQFLDFWRRELDGPLHSITLSLQDGIRAAQLSYTAQEWLH